MTDGRFSWVAGALAGLLFVACAGEIRQPPEDAPRLVLLLVVDQLGAKHLVRYNDLFDGGIRRLLDEGVVFTEAHHAHAKTLTAPGHATVATGCHPSTHGVIGNYWIDRSTGDEIYSVDDDRHDRSPANLECTALGDWMKDRYPLSRVYSLSIKDRSAVLMAGHQADGAYWYDWNGAFTSSSYYREAEPAWLEELNAQGFLASKFGQSWEPLPLAPEAISAIGVTQYDLGPLEEDFPHPIGGASLAPGEYFFNDVYDSPWLHELLLRLARGVTAAHDLGGDAHPDLVAIGFSTTDAVGHDHGPDSREFLDIMLHLDRQLGSFFDWLDETVGMKHVAVAFTSDHGSVPVPEIRAAQGLTGARIGAAQINCFQNVEKGLDEEFGAGDWFRPGPFFAPLPADSLVPAAEVRQRTRDLLEACPAVSRVWLAEELRAEGETEMQRRFARSYFAERSPDLLIEWQEYFLASSGSASSHGTPHRYDTHVPLILWRPGGASGRYEDPVFTADVAPTLASWVGVEPSGKVDGRSLADIAVSQVSASEAAPADG